MTGPSSQTPVSAGVAPASSMRPSLFRGAGAGGPALRPRPRPGPAARPPRPSGTPTCAPGFCCCCATTDGDGRMVANTNRPARTLSALRIVYRTPWLPPEGGSDLFVIVASALRRKLLRQLVVQRAVELWIERPAEIIGLDL